MAVTHYFRPFCPGRHLWWPAFWWVKFLCQSWVFLPRIFTSSVNVRPHGSSVDFLYQIGGAQPRYGFQCVKVQPLCKATVQKWGQWTVACGKALSRPEARPLGRPRSQVRARDGAGRPAAIRLCCGVAHAVYSARKVDAAVAAMDRKDSRPARLTLPPKLVRLTSLFVAFQCASFLC